jgi:predicted nucleic acid-binding protein
MSSTSAISPVSIDTNVLIYSIDSSDAAKQEIADGVVERLIAARGCMPLQCLSEFYALTTRKRLITPHQAERVVERMLMSLVIVSAEALDVVEAMHLQQQHGMQYFDALLIATARRVGCTLFLTEDMQHGRSFGGITVDNPFRSDFRAERAIPLPGAR